MQNLDEAIRGRAYHLWIAEGRLDGKAVAYWLAAQREILSASINGLGTFAPSPRVDPDANETKYPAKQTKAASARKGKRRAA